VGLQVTAKGITAGTHLEGRVVHALSLLRYQWPSYAMPSLNMQCSLSGVIGHTDDSMCNQSTVYENDYQNYMMEDETTHIIDKCSRMKQKNQFNTSLHLCYPIYIITTYFATVTQNFTLYRASSCT